MIERKGFFHVSFDNNDGSWFVTSTANQNIATGIVRIKDGNISKNIGSQQFFVIPLYMFDQISVSETTKLSQFEKFFVYGGNTEIIEQNCCG